MSNGILKEAKEKRKASYKIQPIILHRWSPRAMTGEHITDEEIMSLFEAARWAPSSYNNQPWRFIYAKKNTPQWDLLFNLMGDWNRMWTKNAAVLLVMISKNTFDFNGKPSRTHAFDAGAAWENLALEGSARGLVVHGMEGFDYDKAKKDLDIPEGYEIHAMAAIGKFASKDVLEDPKMKDGEFPSQRKPLNEIIMEGKFRK